MAIAQNQVTGAELRAFDEKTLSEAQERGAFDVVKYCASMAAGVAREWFKSKLWSDEAKYNQYKAALTAKFGDCDPNYSQILLDFIIMLDTVMFH